MSQDFQDARFAFYGQTLYGQPKQKPRWKRTLDAVNSEDGADCKPLDECLETFRLAVAAEEGHTQMVNRR